MEDNKEIVKWLSHMNLEVSSTPLPNTTLKKQHQVDNRQQIIDRVIAKSEKPSLEHLRNAIAETTAEDTALAKEISELLDELQISPQTLANDVKDSLSKVSVVLRANGLSEVDETALILSMDGKRVEEKKQQRMNRSLKTKYEELLNRHSVLKGKLNYLRDNVGSIKNSVVENEVDYKNEYSSYKLQTAKLVEYKATVDTIESKINSMNLKDLEPDKILDKYKKFMERKGQLAAVNKALMPYGNLPPNLLQAKALLESKELEYNEISQMSSSI